MSRTRLFALLFAALIGLWARPASADDEPARALYKEALTAYDAGEYERALPMFRQVVAALDSPNAMLYVGRCLRELGEPALAHQAMTAAMRSAAARVPDEPRYAETRDAVAAERGALSPKVGLVVLAVPPDVSGVAVRLNGEALADDDLGEPLAVMPGRVTIEATAPGRTGLTREVTVGAGDAETITLTFEPVASEVAPVTGPETGPTVEDEASPLGPVRIAGIAVAGLGVAGLVTFGVTGAMADSKFDELFDRCGGTTCPDAEADEVASGRRLDTIANVSLVVGLAASVAGAAMIVFGGPGEPDDPSEAWLLVGPTSIGLGGTF